MDLLSSLLFAFVLGGLQHLFLPQAEEVRRVGVELQAVLLIIPAHTHVLSRTVQLLLPQTQHRTFHGFTGGFVV